MVKFVVKYVVKFVVKLKNCQIGTKMGVIVDIDSPIVGESFLFSNILNSLGKGKKNKNKKKWTGGALWGGGGGSGKIFAGDFWEIKPRW